MSFIAYMSFTCSKEYILVWTGHHFFFFSRLDNHTNIWPRHQWQGPLQVNKGNCPKNGLTCQFKDLAGRQQQEFLRGGQYWAGFWYRLWPDIHSHIPSIYGPALRLALKQGLFLHDFMIDTVAFWYRITVLRPFATDILLRRFCCCTV